MKTKRHTWTVEEVLLVIKLWDTHTKEEIGKKIGVKASSVGSIAVQIGKAGYKLFKPRENNSLVIKEAIELLKKEK